MNTFSLFCFWGNWEQIKQAFGGLSVVQWPGVWLGVWLAAAVVLAAWEWLRAALLSIKTAGGPVLTSGYACGLRVCAGPGSLCHDRPAESTCARHCLPGIPDKLNCAPSPKLAALQSPWRFASLLSAARRLPWARACVRNACAAARPTPR